MKTLRITHQNEDVAFLQQLLSGFGFSLPTNGHFEEKTMDSIIKFQADQNLVADGIVGPNTWRVLIEKCCYPSAANQLLASHDYYQAIIPKKTIYLHHTAGGHNPNFVVDWWKQSKVRVATSFVIGRKSNRGNSKFDGKVFRAFNEFYWAHHLGTRRWNNRKLNKESIGIEICSFGPLVKDGNNYFFEIPSKSKPIRIKVPPSEVVKLDNSWRGSIYFHKYTDQQIEACRHLLLHLAFQFNIPIPDRHYSPDWFDIDQDALSGEPGIWTHCNVRKDKTDCFPQVELIDMLNGLHDDFKTFNPNNFTKTRGIDKLENAILYPEYEDVDFPGSDLLDIDEGEETGETMD